ncbi:MAG TPA: MBL fold metallo-hydrolase, partial [Longimicrobiales bacterium]|nr:MBL fold metallo-hydrolase [Longimicrobiales bacterium]
PIVWDDQALVCNVKNKGLVVVTGCAHAGAINTLLYAQALTGVSPVYAFLGGLHLSGAAFEPRIAQTVADLTALQPSIVVPAHCTGLKATHAIAAALPNAFIQNSVGTRYHLV